MADRSQRTVLSGLHYFPVALWSSNLPSRNIIRRAYTHTESNLDGAHLYYIYRYDNLDGAIKTKHTNIIVS